MGQTDLEFKEVKNVSKIYLGFSGGQCPLDIGEEEISRMIGGYR